ncbi:hypothetical protein KC19_6G176100 [Ceratodon purpureus]|uniref:Uncharacterized protein n=1 Tax=Ceratodon purpureus TaxID=3225 RepID=A0A8T0HHF8_CERPU|nr:hypothetical protein KC19_6G176100 [Ceratodon purpureus]
MSHDASRPFQSSHDWPHELHNPHTPPVATRTPSLRCLKFTASTHKPQQLREEPSEQHRTKLMFSKEGPLHEAVEKLQHEYLIRKQCDKKAKRGIDNL